MLERDPSGPRSWRLDPGRHGAPTIETSLDLELNPLQILPKSVSLDGIMSTMSEISNETAQSSWFLHSAAAQISHHIQPNIIETDLPNDL